MLHKHLLAFCIISLFYLAGCANFGKKAADAADIYTQLGLRYLSMNKLDMAKENLQKALAKDSSNAQAYNGLAFLYEKLKKPQEAKHYYEKALDLDPEDLGVQNNYGRFLCDQRQFDKGLAYLKQASSTPLNNRPWLAMTNTGRCYTLMGQPHKAEPYFQQALALDDTYAPALAEMQRMSYERNDFPAAEQYLQRYLATAEHTPETLWIAIHTERALGNHQIATEYQNLLLKNFPLSEEANKIKAVMWQQPNN